MDIVAKFGRDDLAVLYVAKKGDRYLEFAESLQPPHPRDEKWVLIISTMYGCPVHCIMCDAGSYYKCKLSTDEIFEQIDYMVINRYPKGIVPIKKFKIQFARMGEPTLNPNVLEVMRALPKRYPVKGLMPCISTIAPEKGSSFMEELIWIKNQLYPHGNFQLQFSIHTTDERMRKKIIPYPIWSLKEINDYSERFYVKGDRKITLNFAAEKNYPVYPPKIAEIFDPTKFFIKLTPLNPTEAVKSKHLQSLITSENDQHLKELIKSFETLGFETILSIGELEENLIGSNCGQHAIRFENGEMIVEKYSHNFQIL